MSTQQLEDRKEGHEGLWGKEADRDADPVNEFAGTIEGSAGQTVDAAEAPVEPDTDRPASYRDVFGVKEFRAVFAADLLSLIGDQVAAVAVAVMLYQDSGSPLLAAAGYATAYVPWLLGGPLLAAWAERFPGRSVMVACDLARALLIGIAALTGMAPLAVAGLVFLSAMLAPPFDAARSALLAQILTGNRYPVGMSLRQAVHQTAQLCGFAVGGALVLALSAPGVLALNCLTFLASAALLRAGLVHRAAPQMGDAGEATADEAEDAGGDEEESPSSHPSHRGLAVPGPRSAEEAADEMAGLAGSYGDPFHLAPPSDPAARSDLANPTTQANVPDRTGRIRHSSSPERPTQADSSSLAEHQASANHDAMPANSHNAARLYPEDDPSENTKPLALRNAIPALDHSTRQSVTTRVPGPRGRSDEERPDGSRRRRSDRRKADRRTPQNPADPKESDSERDNNTGSTLTRSRARAVTAARAGKLRPTRLRHRGRRATDPRPSQRRRSTASSSTSIWQDMVAGAQVVRGDVQIWFPLMLGIVGAAYAIVPEAIAVAYAAELGHGSSAVGLIMAAAAAGSVVGGLAIGRFAAPSAAARLMYPLALVGTLPLLIIALRPGLLVSLALFLLCGLGQAFQVVANTQFASHVPTEMRTRAFGLAIAGLYGGQSVAILLAGAAAQWLAPSTVIAGSGLLGALGLLLLPYLRPGVLQARGRHTNEW